MLSLLGEAVGGLVGIWRGVPGKGVCCEALEGDLSSSKRAQSACIDSM